ncbi:hypothetical protein ACH0CM_12615 [Streptomyces albus]|uniref:hypothetical protein n=1 Tax=Streptomyces albus TaxID=1888 RepID=UPI0038792B23
MLDRPRNHEPIPWRHSVISTPLYTAATVYTGGLALGVVEDLGATLPLGWMGIGSAAGIVAASASRYIRAKGKGWRRWYHTGFTATWTTAAYAWLNWTAHGSPWTFAAASTVAGAAAVFTPLYTVDRWMRKDAIAEQWADETAALSRGERGEWEQLLQDVGARGVNVGKPYKTRSGYALPLSLTETTFESLLGMLPMLETRKGDLRTGSLQLRRGPSGYASDAVLFVATRDVLSETVPLPEDVHPLTIQEPLTLGLLESGEPLEILFRQNSIFIAGKKGSGKSVFLHVIIAAITRCIDAVIWMIDLAQGNTAKRWLRPWAEGWKDRSGRLIDRPILDWVATDHEEALRLLNASLAVGDGRARRMKGGKIRPSAQVPALIVISDENPDLMATNAAAIQTKTRGVKKGRKAAVDYVDTGQRGTGPNTGGGEIASQYDTIIGMKFREKAEGQFVFPGYYSQIDLSKLPGNGSLYILDTARLQEGGIGPERAKGHFVNDDDEDDHGNALDVIEQMAVDRWDIRPDLDKESQQDAAPWGYEDRWSAERTGWLADALGLGTATAPGEQQATKTPSVATATSTPPDLPDLDEYINRHRDWRPTDTPAQPEPQPQPETEEETDEAMQEAIAAAVREAERIAAAAVPPQTRRHPRRDEVIQWVKDAGDDGITVAQVRERLLALYPDETPPSVTAVQNWFAEHEHITKPKRGLYVWAETEES